MGREISLAPFNYQDDWRLDVSSIPIGAGAGYMIGADIVEITGIQADLWIGFFVLASIAMGIVTTRDLLYMMAGNRVETDE